MIQAITPTLPQENFAYDDIGNRTSDNNSSYVYDESKQLIKEDWKYFYVFDQSGNLTSKQEKNFNGNVQNFEYSSENQLKKFKLFENGILIKEVSYAYDALGRRVEKEVIDLQDQSKSFTRRYVYDGNEILAEYDGDNELKNTYTHSTLRTDDILSVTNIQGTFYFVKDAQGSITDITDENGIKVQHYAYSAYGKLLKVEDGNGTDITSNPAIKTAFTYTGREFDEETGLYYYRARYYDPSIGRFLQEDPHPGDAGRPITLINKYTYAGNNPTKYRDPSGKIFGVDDLIIIGAFAVAGGLLEGSNKGWTLDNVFVGMLKGAALGASFIGVSSLLGAASSVGAGGGAFTGAMAPGAGSVLLAGALAIPAGVGMFASGAPDWTKNWAKGYAIAGAAGNLLRAGVWFSEMNGYEAALTDSVANEGMPAAEQADVMSFINAGYRIGDFMLFSAGLSLIPLGLKK